MEYRFKGRYASCHGSASNTEISKINMNRHLVPTDQQRRTYCDSSCTQCRKGEFWEMQYEYGSIDMSEDPIYDESNHFVGRSHDNNCIVNASHIPREEFFTERPSQMSMNSPQTVSCDEVLVPLDLSVKKDLDTSKSITYSPSPICVEQDTSMKEKRDMHQSSQVCPKQCHVHLESRTKQGIHLAYHAYNKHSYDALLGGLKVKQGSLVDGELSTVQSNGFGNTSMQQMAFAESDWRATYQTEPYNTDQNTISSLTDRGQGNNMVSDIHVVDYSADSPAQLYQAKSSEICCRGFDKRFLRFSCDACKQNKQRYVCPFCNKDYQSFSRFKEHILAKHEGITVDCPVCGKQFACKYSMKLHKNQQHDNMYRMVCNICGKGYNNAGQYKAHMNKHFNIKAYSCKGCGKRYFSSTSLSHHKRVCLFSKDPYYFKRSAPIWTHGS